MAHIETIPESEFSDLVGHLRSPPMGLHREINWFVTADRSGVGLLVLDLIDKDYSWVYFARCVGGYETVDVAVSYSTEDEAFAALYARMQQG